MSNLNWPESATHYGSETLQFNPGFYKKDGDKWLFMSECFAPKGAWNPASKEDSPSRYIERPTAQPKQWSGPQDGLPPVGTVCELSESVLLADSETSDWFEAGTKVEVGGHAIFDGATGPVCVICVVDENFTGTITDGCLRPANTAEQLAAEQRETAIREIMDIADVDCRVTAARLVDAGFKREVV